MRNISLKCKVKLCIIMQLMVREIKKSTQTRSENLSKEIAEKDTHTSHISFGYLGLPCRSLCSLLKTLSASQGMVQEEGVYLLFIHTLIQPTFSQIFRHRSSLLEPSGLKNKSLGPWKAQFFLSHTRAALSGGWREAAPVLPHSPGRTT